MFFELKKRNVGRDVTACIDVRERETERERPFRGRVVRERMRQREKKKEGLAGLARLNCELASLTLAPSWRRGGDKAWRGGARRSDAHNPAHNAVSFGRVNSASLGEP